MIFYQKIRLGQWSILSSALFNSSIGFKQLNEVNILMTPVSFLCMSGFLSLVKPKFKVKIKKTGKVFDMYYKFFLNGLLFRYYFEVCLYHV